MAGVNLMGRVSGASKTGKNGKPAKLEREQSDDEVELNVQDDEMWMKVYEDVKQEIEQVEENAGRVDSVKARFLRAMDKTEEQQALKQLGTVIAENKKVAESAKTKLKKLKLANDKENIAKSGSSVVQMKTNEWNACARKFQQASTRFQTSLTQFNNELKGRQKRLIGAIDQDISNEEMEKLVNDPNKAQAYIQESFQMVDVGDAMLTRLAEIESRTQGMKNIYDNLEELRAMWDELNFLTSQQQEMIDNIDYNVQKTSENVNQANKNLEKAEAHQIRSRKCQLILLCTCLALLLVIVLGVMGGTGVFSNS